MIARGNMASFTNPFGETGAPDGKPRQ